MAELSSINIEPSKINNTEHNTRFVSPTYLLKEKSLGVEYDLNHEDAEVLYQSLLKEAVTNYTQRTGQQLQAKKLRWSAVVNIKDTTTMDDLKKLTQKLYQEYGWQCYQIAIHRDEGHKDPDTGETIYNLHAHLEFLMLNKKGIYCFKKGEWGKGRMSKLQDLVAEQLQMKRGETLKDRIKNIAELLSADISEILRGKDETYTAYCKRLNLIAEQKGIENFNAGSFLKGKTRVNHYQYKQQMMAVEDALRQQKAHELQKVTSLNNEVTELNSKLSSLNNRFMALETAYKDAPIKTIKELNELKEKIRREMIAEGGFEQEDYKVLGAIVNTIKKDKSYKNFTFKNVFEQIILGLKATSERDNLQKQNGALQADNEKLKVQNTEANTKIVNLNQSLQEVKAELKNIKDHPIIKKEPRELTDDEIRTLPQFVKLETAFNDAPIKTKKDLDELKAKIRREMIAEGGFTQEDYKILSATVAEIKKFFNLQEHTVKDVINQLAKGQNLETENKSLKADISTLQASEQKLKAQNTLAANEDEQQKNVFNAKIAEKDSIISEKDKKIKEINAKLAEKPKTREYTLEEIEKLPRVVDLKTIIKDLKAKLELKPKEIVKTVKQELSEDDIEQLPRVKELCNEVKQLTDDNTILKTKLKEKPKEVRVEVPTIKTVTVQRELTNEELTNLPIVRELSLDNEQLRNENAQLSAQIGEHQDGLALLVGRIDDEGFPEIAESIAQSGQSGSIREIYEKIADFFSSTLKRSVQKVAKTVGNAFKLGR